MFPIVMPSNLRKFALQLNQTFPKRIALLLSPNGWTNPKNLPFALDNGRFSVWSKGKEWKEDDFWKIVDKANHITYPPCWLAVPDVVTNAEETIKEWKKWYPVLSKYNWPLALVVQDGMIPEEINRNLSPKPDIIFVGGSTLWKWRMLENWVRIFPRVHVGRVNTGRMLWKVHRAGAESSDGTGWFHHTQKKQLILYLSRSSKYLGERDIFGFY